MTSSDLVWLESGQQVSNTVNVVEFDVPYLDEAGHCPLEHFWVSPQQFTHLLENLRQKKQKSHCYY